MRHSGHKARAALPWCRQTVLLPEGGALRGVHEYACPALPPDALVMTATAASPCCRDGGGRPGGLHDVLHVLVRGGCTPCSGSQGHADAQGLPSHQIAFQAVENSRGYRSDNRSDTVQITGHSRLNLLERKALVIGQL